MGTPRILVGVAALAAALVGAPAALSGVPVGFAGCDGAASSCTALAVPGGADAEGPHAIALSPDGRDLYALHRHVVVHFHRDTITGALDFADCVEQKSASVADAECSDLPGTQDPIGRAPAALAMAPDGRDLVVAARSADTLLTVLDLRVSAADGSLSVGSCVAGVAGDLCTAGFWPDPRSSATGVAVSPDGGSVLVTASTFAPALWNFDLADGTLSLRQCFDFPQAGTPSTACTNITGGLNYSSTNPADGEDVAAAADGRDVYLASSPLGVLHFARAADGALTFANCIGQQHCAAIGVVDAAGRALEAVARIAVAGSDVYVGNSAEDFDRVGRTFTHLRRDSAGDLSLVSCVTPLVDPAGVCAAPPGGVPIYTIASIFASTDGADVYAVDSRTGDVLHFVHDATTGAATLDGCIGTSAPCTGGVPADISPTLGRAALAPDGLHLYVPASGAANALIHIGPTGAPSVVREPKVVGSAQAGSTLTAADAVWATSTPLSVTRRWQRCSGDATTCADVPGATGTTYVLGASDVGAHMRLVEAAANASGTASAASGLGAAVVAGTHMLTVGRSGNGSGAVTGIACASTCSATVADGASVTLHAVAGAGSVFAGWAGGGCSAAPDCTLVVTADTAVTASFDVQPPPAPAPAATPAPPRNDRVPGTGSAGITVAQTTTGTHGGWSGTAPIKLADEWEVCSELADTSCVLRVAGLTFSPAAGDGGKWARLKETATNGAGTTVAYSGRMCIADAQHACAVKPSGGGGGTSTAGPTAFYALRLAVDPNGGGTVAGACADDEGGPCGTGILATTVCASSCTVTGFLRQTWTLRAAPAPGFRFAGWSGACGGSSSCAVDLADPAAAVQSVTAEFVRTSAKLPLTVLRIGTGAGRVASSATAPAIACGRVCAQLYNRGTVVTLSASPSAGSYFRGWSGACRGAATCVVSMRAARTVGADFGLRPPSSAALVVAGVGVGVVRSVGARAVDCGIRCVAALPLGAVVALSAEPGPGAYFVGWRGACAGAGGCAVTMGGDRGVTAVFAPRLPDVAVLTVTAASPLGAGGGVVQSSDDPRTIDCDSSPSAAGTVAGATTRRAGTLCSHAYVQGTEVTLHAVPEQGFSFGGWLGGGCSGGGDCTRTLRADALVTAVFVQRPPNTGFLTVAPTGAPGTIVSDDPDRSISCDHEIVDAVRGVGSLGARCSNWFPVGTTVTLHAAGTGLSVFRGWIGGGCFGAGACTITLGAVPVVVRADFTPRAPDSSILAVQPTPALGGGVVRESGVLPSQARINCSLNAGNLPSPSGGASGAVAAAGDVSRCAQAFSPGTTMHLTAIADSHSLFTGWGGACASAGGDPSCTVVVRGPLTTVWAWFVPTSGSTIPVAVAAAGVTAGRIFSDDLKIDCNFGPTAVHQLGVQTVVDPAVCAAAVAPGATVTLHALSALGPLTGWSGGGCSGTGACTVVVTRGLLVVAHFEPQGDVIAEIRAGVRDAVTAIEQGLLTVRQALDAGVLTAEGAIRAGLWTVDDALAAGNGIVELTAAGVVATLDDLPVDRSIVALPDAQRRQVLVDAHTRWSIARSDAVSAVTFGLLSGVEAVRWGLTTVGDAVGAGLLSARAAIDAGLISADDAVRAGLISAADAVRDGYMSIEHAIDEGFISRTDAIAAGLIDDASAPFG